MRNHKITFNELNTCESNGIPFSKCKLYLKNLNKKKIKTRNNKRNITKKRKRKSIQKRKSKKKIKLPKNPPDGIIINENGILKKSKNNHWDLL